MRNSRTKTVWLSAALALGLAGCSAYDGRGYGGVNVGYGYGYGYPAGAYGSDFYSTGLWYNDYYYPGTGYYVYDRRGRAQVWNNDQRRYFEGRRYTLRDREDRSDFRNFRRDGIEDRRAFRSERRDDREALRSGQVTPEQFRADRAADRRAFRQERRADTREFRRDLRDRPDGRVRGERRGRPR